MRFQRKEVDVLVEIEEKWKPRKKPKKERIKPIEPSKRLDKWMERWCLYLWLRKKSLNG